MAPASRSVEPQCVAPGRDAAELSGLPPAVVETITQARAPSTRQTYALKWSTPMRTPMHWRTAPLWQTPAELRAGRHRTPSQESAVSALSQSLPACWVTGNGREELAGVTLATGIRAPFFSSSSVPRAVNPGGILQSPRQSDWAEQSEARPSTGASSPGSPVSRPCTGLGVHLFV